MYPIVRQLEKNNGEKSGSESSKIREKQILDPLGLEPPLSLGHISVNNYLRTYSEDKKSTYLTTLYSISLSQCHYNPLILNVIFLCHYGLKDTYQYLLL